MTFLNPAYLFGLFAAALPVIIHFLNLRKLKTVEFSTLKFLKEIQKTKIRNLKIKQWLLLVIRVLIIIFLVLAFSRPTVKNVSISGADGLSKTSAVIIIDNSVSMSANDSRGSAFDEAKNFALNLLKYFQNGDEILIMPSTLENTENLNFSKDIKSAEKNIEQIRLSFISNDISVSFFKAYQMLKKSGNVNKEIYILSDFQKGKFMKEKIRLGENVNNNIKVFFADFKKNISKNLSAVDFKLNNQILEKNILLNFTSEIQNSGTDYLNGVASLFINNERVSQNSFELPGNQRIEINHEYLLNTVGLTESSIELEDDDLSLDNKHYNSFYIPEKINLLCVSDVNESTKYIQLVMENAAENIAFTKIASNQIHLQDMNKYDLIIIIGKPAISAAGLSSMIPNNKSIIIFPAYNSTEKDFNEILSAFSFGKAALVNSETFVEFDKLAKEHPVLNGLFEEDKIKNVESPQIRKYFRINSSNSSGSIISLQDNYSFLLEKKTSERKVFVFSVSPDTYNSDFSLKGIFAPLILKSVYYLSTKTKPSDKYFAGDEIIFELPQETEYVDIIKPDGVEEHVQNKSGKMFKYKNTEQIGCYKFYSNKKLIYFDDINLNPEECNYNFYSLSEASKYFSSKTDLMNVYKIQNKANTGKIIIQSRLGAELWKYFIVLVLFLLLLEMIIARNSKKEISLVMKND
jgi:hypothetical protein